MQFDILECIKAGIEMRAVGEEVASIDGVRAGEIQHEIVGAGREQPRGGHVFADDPIRGERSRAGPAVCHDEIDAKGNRHMRSCQSRRDGAGSVVGQAVMHDDSLVLRQPPQPGFWISGGWIDRNRTDLHGPEPECGQRRDRRPAFVKAGGEADRCRKPQSGNARLQSGRGRYGLSLASRQRPNRAWHRVRSRPR